MSDAPNVRTTFAELAEITARTAVLDERKDELRAQLKAEGLDAFARLGAMPTFRVNGLGRASLSDPDPKARVVDEAKALAWVEANAPTEVELTVTGGPELVAVLEAGYEALNWEDGRARFPVERAIRKAYLPVLLQACRIADVDDLGRVVDGRLISPDGSFVDGIEAAQGDPTLTVTLDPEAKARARAALLYADELDRGEVVPCGRCQATGDVHGEPCPECHGDRVRHLVPPQPAATCDGEEHEEELDDAEGVPEEDEELVNAQAPASVRAGLAGDDEAFG